MKRTLSILISILLILSSMLSVMPAFADEPAADVKVFGLFSDTHDAARTKADGTSAAGSNGGIGRVMNDIFSRAGVTADDLSALDGVVMAGDIVYMSGDGKGGFADGDETAYNTFNSIDKVQKIKDADKLVYAMGNHEIPLQANGESVINSSRELFEAETGLAPEHVKTLGGYTFIAAGAENYNPGSYLARESWLRQEIDKALADGSTKPVFLVLHHAMADSFYDTAEESYNSGVYSDEFKSYVTSQPRLVVISGHAHIPSANPQTIRQIENGCTFIQTSHVSGGNSVSDPYADYSGDGFSNAIMMEIDSSNVVTFKRFHVDGNGGEKLGSDWVLDIPAMINGSQSAYRYTDRRFGESKSPVFTEGVKAEVSDITSASAIINFPVAQAASSSENDQIQYYKYSVMDMDNAALFNEEIYMSDFYKPASKQLSEMSYAVKGLNANTSYRVSIIPITAFFKEAAKPLTVDFKTEKNVSYIGEKIVKALDAAGTNVVDTNLKRENNGGNGAGTNYGGSWALSGNGYVTFEFEITDPGVYRFTSKVACGNGSAVLTVANKDNPSEKKEVAADNIITGGFSVPNDNFYWMDMALNKGTYTAKILRKADTVRLYNLTAGKIGEISAGDIAYEIKKNVLERTDGVYLGNPNAENSALSAGYNGYITWEITPEYTGTYSINVNFNASSDTTCYLYNSSYTEKSDENLIGQAMVNTGYGKDNLVEFGKLAMIKGNTYTFTLFNPKTNTAASPYIKYFLAKWDSEIDVAANPVSVSKKFSERKDTSINTSWAGMEDNSWITFEFEVPVDAIYKATVSAGVKDGITVTVSSGGQTATKFFEKTAEHNDDNLAWNTKKSLDIGEFALKAGIHEFKISTSEDDGATMLFNLLTLTSVAEYELVTDNITVEGNAFDRKMSSTQSGHIGSKGVMLAQKNYFFEYDVEVSEANYMLSLYYGIYSADPENDKPTSEATVHVDGVNIGVFPLEFSQGYVSASKWVDLTAIRLSEGVHTIKFTWGGGGDKYYSIGKFALDSITEPVTMIYNGTTINSNTLISTLTDESGSLTARAMLPRAMSGMPVTMVFALYEDGMLCNIAVNDITAGKASIIPCVLNGVSFDEGKEYETRVFLLDNLNKITPYYPVSGMLKN